MAKYRKSGRTSSQRKALLRSQEPIFYTEERSLYLKQTKEIPSRSL